MIEASTVRALSHKQLKQLCLIDFDCEGMDCVECPLFLEPQTEKIESGRYFTYRCISAYAAHLLKKGW